jgi:low affinity Fe/Cu permease
MNRLGQDSNVAAESAKATAHLSSMRAASVPSAKVWCMAKNGAKRGKNKGGGNGNGRDERDFFCRIRDAFGVFARKTSTVLGSAWAFVCAILIIVIWAMTGPTFHYSDTWQLIINTGTTIVTFLMVFLIQNTQNRDAKAVHLKLDELIRAVEPARNKLVDLEKLSDDELKKLESEFEKLRKKAEGAKEEVEELKDAASS